MTVVAGDALISQGCLRSLFSLDQHFQRPPQMPLNERLLRLAADGGQFPTARLLLLVAHLRGKTSGRRVGARRIPKEVSAGVAHFAGNMERTLKRRSIF